MSSLSQTRPFEPEKEFSAMVAVNGITLNASIWTTADYTQSMDLLMKHGTARNPS